MTEAKTEKKEWVKVPSKSGVWKGESIGYQLEGIYLRRVLSPFRGRDNWKYCIECDHPIAGDGVVTVFGTTGLNSAMDDIPTGYKIKIIYQGEKPASDPMHKAFKKYDVYAEISKKDPLYLKLYPVEFNENNKPHNSEMKTAEDREARNTIDHYIEVMKDQHLVITCEAVIVYIKSDPDFDENSEDMTRVKFELMRMHKAGEIKRAKEID